MQTLNFKVPLDEGQNKKLRSEFTKRLGERLREIRKQKGLTQQELAEKAILHLTALLNPRCVSSWDGGAPRFDSCGANSYAV